MIGYIYKMKGGADAGNSLVSLKDGRDCL